MSGTRRLLSALAATAMLCWATPPALATEATVDPQAEWESALRSDRRLVQLMDAADRSQEDLDRWTLRLEQLVEARKETIPSTERRAICIRLWEPVVRSMWVSRVLAPSITVASETIEAEYRRGVEQGLDRAPGVKVLEIFLWAPEDQPEFRRDRLELARSIHQKAITPELFSTAAQDVSDATSYYKGGSIGTIHADQINDQLRAVLFTGRTGPTEILETEYGIYLFYVINLVPAKTHDPSTVRARIRRTLLQQTVRDTLADRMTALASELDGRMASPLPTTEAVPVFTIGDRSYTLDEVLPGLPTREIEAGLVETAFHAHLAAADLERAGFSVPIPDTPACTIAIAHRVMEVMVEEAVKDPTKFGLGVDAPTTPAPKTVETWSFDVLYVTPVADQEAWLGIVRVAHEYDLDHTNLDALADRIEDELEFSTRIENHRDIAPGDVAHLGPEIHTSLRRFLEPGGRSRVLHLASKQTAVVVVLRGKSSRIAGDDTDLKDRRFRQKRNQTRRSLYVTVLDGEAGGDATEIAAPGDSQ